MIANQEQLAPWKIEPTWHRRRVWWFTELQNGDLVWPGTMVEYEKIVIDFCGWMLGSPHTVTHYRVADNTLEIQKC